MRPGSTTVLVTGDRCSIRRVNIAILRDRASHEYEKSNNVVENERDRGWLATIGRDQTEIRTPQLHAKGEGSI